MDDLIDGAERKIYEFCSSGFYESLLPLLVAHHEHCPPEIRLTGWPSRREPRSRGSSVNARRSHRARLQIASHPEDESVAITVLQTAVDVNAYLDMRNPAQRLTTLFPGWI